jgi:hypothetical protein
MIDLTRKSESWINAYHHKGSMLFEVAASEADMKHRELHADISAKLAGQLKITHDGNGIVSCEVL